jgi:hypothetical protein
MPSQTHEINQEVILVDITMENQQEPLSDYDIQNIRIPDEVIATWKVVFPSSIDYWGQ